MQMHTIQELCKICGVPYYKDHSRILKYIKIHPKEYKDQWDMRLMERLDSGMGW